MSEVLFFRIVCTIAKVTCVESGLESVWTDDGFIEMNVSVSVTSQCL